MLTQKPPSFFTLLLLISFASVNAVLFTPALPAMTKWFGIGDIQAQQTMFWFLLGYALGQLLYGPLANRFGRKPALYMGIGVQIVSSFVCAHAGTWHSFNVLLCGRFFLAVGSGVGLKMTFTLVNECFQPEEISNKIAYLGLAFAVTPGLAVALGGLLTANYGWQSCFYAGAVYGLILFLLVSRLAETKLDLQRDALKIKPLMCGYARQFANKRLMAGGILMGGATSFIYVFAALAPFIAMDLMGMNSVQYGLYAVLPSAGLVLGSVLSARFSKKIGAQKAVTFGIAVAGVSVLLMLLAVVTRQSALISLFIPMIFIYFGVSFVFANASAVAMRGVVDTSNASAVMSFVNMGLTTVLVLSLNLFAITPLLLPLLLLGVSFGMIVLAKMLER